MLRSSPHRWLLVGLGFVLAAWAANTRRAPSPPSPPPEIAREAHAPASIAHDPAPHDSSPESSVAHDAPSKEPIAPRVSNVLLLTVDAFRADQSWSGYDGAKTPNLDRFAKESVVFDRAYAVANTTTPSLAAILSARYPTELRRDDCSLAGFRYDDGLARTVARAGIHTFAAHGHAIFASTFAPKDGFSEWKLIEKSGGRRAADGAVTGEEIASLVTAFLDAPDRPPRFFAWAHFVDPHDRYVPHDDFPPSSHATRGLYDGEVAYTDHVIGRVLEALEKDGLAASTAVIVTADHGEAFGEHDRFRHGFSVYDEEIHVPLLVRVPGVPPRRVATARSTIDLARTITALLGVDAPSVWRGASLASDLAGEPSDARPVIVDTPELQTLPAQRAVVLGSKKVLAPGGKPTTVFDLAHDPGERSPKRGDEVEPVLRDATAALASIRSVPADPCMRDAPRRH